MTPQEIFDRVVLHLAKQGRKAARRDANGVAMACEYRSKDGLSCAIGCLIPDDEYDPGMEVGGAHILASVLGLGDPKYVEVRFNRDLAESAPVTVALFKEHRQLLGGLQEAHDSPRTGQEMRAILGDVAKGHDLDTTVLYKVRFPEKWR